MIASAERQIYGKFIEATKYLPQVPHGCVELGSLALNLHASSELSWGDTLRLPLAGEDLEQAVHLTNLAHARVGLPENPGLYRSLPFAFELVRADLASSFPATEKQDTIEPISPELVRRSVAFMQDPGKQAFATHVLRKAIEVLRSPETTRDIGKYQVAIRDVAQRYRNSNDTGGRMREMDNLRQSVTDLTRGPMTDQLRTLQGEAPLGLDMEIVAHNLTRWQPSKELVTTHFG